MPSDVATLETLPGVGPYTARAVAAIAFGVPVGAVDTNVRRVLTRMTADDGAAPDRAGRPGARRRVRPARRPGRLDACADGHRGDALPRRPDRLRIVPGTTVVPLGRDGSEPTGASGDVARRPRRREPTVPFPTTTRWLRGRVLDRLRAADGDAFVALEAPIGVHDRAAVDRAVDGLARDGLIELRADRVGAAADGLTTVRLRLPARCPPPSIPSVPPSPPTTRRSSSRTCAGSARHWAAQAALPPITGEAMTGTDLRAQALGVPQERLMEHAGTAVAAAVRALAIDLDRWGTGPIVILCGPGNNGGDGLVAARRLALAGASVIVGLVAPEARPSGAVSARNWDRIARDDGIRKVHLPNARDVAIFGTGIDKAAVIVDALLGTGVSGPLRDPIRSAVELIVKARPRRHPGRGRRHPDRDRPLERRAVRARRSGPTSRSPSIGRRRGSRPAAASRTRARSSSRRSASRPRRTVAEPSPSGRQPGWREVAIVALVVVAVVLGLAVLTSLLPTTFQEVVFHTPLAILVLIVGTGWLLWRISRRPVDEPGDEPRT